MAKQLLTERAVRALRKKPGVWATGLNIYLSVAATPTGAAGSASWLLRYTVRGKARAMGLGSARVFGLAKVREMAREHMEHVAKKIDPLDQRASDIEEARLREEEARKAALAEIPFKDDATRYMDLHEPTWKNVKHRRQWRSTIGLTFETLGDRPAAAIDDAAIAETVAPIWSKQPETARRVKWRIMKICEWVKKGRLPPEVAPVTVHHAALDYRDIPAFMGGLRQRESAAARALEFLVLTAARTGEVLGARWDEIDMADKVWTVPAARIKAGREHEVPLSARAVEILAALPRTGEYIFPRASDSARPLSNKVMPKVLAELRDGVTVHGMRSTFSTWANDSVPGVDSKTVEAALAHIEGDKTEQAYNRARRLVKRTALMDAWASYCGGDADSSSKVVSILRA